MMASLLPNGRAFVEHALREEEQQLARNRLVLTEVHQVLDEMIYDVETHDRECEVIRLRHELAMARVAIQDAEEREKILIAERQKAHDHAKKVESDGRMIMARLSENLGVLMAELEKKDLLEKELVFAKEQLQLSAQISKELAKAQREIRELHRNNSIQRLLTSNGKGRMHVNNVVTVPCNSLQRQTLVTSTREKSNQDEERRDILSACSDDILKQIFSFADANTVFIASLTSRTMMRRVNVLFGIETKQRRRIEQQPHQSRVQRQHMMNRGHSFNMHSEKEKAQLAKAELIVKSLNKDAIKYFHDMSNQVKTLQNHLTQVQAEKEDVAARLHSAESVRDFLMEKLKELEDRLANMMEATTKRDEQTAMDREIIGFLDAKTQEYEVTLERYANHNNDLVVELEKLKEQHGSKMTIVQDMVRLLSDEKKELEIQLRSQRKVLVREVKTLRAQNHDLASDRERYFTQLKQLRYALQHLDELR